MVLLDIESGVQWLTERGIGRGPDRDPDAVRQLPLYVAILTVPRRAQPTCRSTPTTPESGRSWCSARPASPESSPRTAGPGIGFARDLPAGRPEVTDDAWIIFTSGSTRDTEGWRSPTATPPLVDAEARMFLQDSPIGPDDRVLAGLSVAFDASCEEMWLWRQRRLPGAPPRSLVRSGMTWGRG